MILPQNLPFAAFVLQLSRADRSFSRLDQQLVETPTSLSDSSPCSSVTFLPSVVTEFTEYKCQSVCKQVRWACSHALTDMLYVNAALWLQILSFHDVKKGLSDYGRHETTTYQLRCPTVS